MKGGRYEIRDGKSVRVSGTEGVGRTTHKKDKSKEVKQNANQKKSDNRKA